MKALAFIFGVSVDPHEIFKNYEWTWPLTDRGQGHKLQKTAILIEKNSNSESMKA